MRFRVMLSVIAVLGVAGPVMADVKIVQVNSVTSATEQAMLKRMSAEERAEAAREGIGVPVRTVTYISGSHIRVDTGNFTTLIDTAKRTSTILNRQTHEYEVRPFTPGKSRGTSSVKKTGDTRTILGHHATRYHVTTEMENGMTASTDIWAARDLPRPASIDAAGASTSAMGTLKQIDGMPLLVTVHANTGNGDALITSTVKSIVNGSIPASMFQIPAGFRPAPPGAGVGAPSTFPSLGR